MGCTFYNGRDGLRGGLRGIAAALLGIGGETMQLIALMMARKIERYACAVPHLEAISDFEVVGVNGS